MILHDGIHLLGYARSVSPCAAVIRVSVAQYCKLHRPLLPQCQGVHVGTWVRLRRGRPTQSKPLWALIGAIGQYIALQWGRLPVTDNTRDEVQCFVPPEATTPES